METALSWVLRIGVLFSAILIIVGLTLTFITKDISNPFCVMELGWMIWGNPFFEPSHILFLGYAVLITTPVLGVAVSLLIFLKVHDLPFATITLIVFLILIVSMTVGIG
jgi:uncharacterized membrane protein